MTNVKKKSEFMFILFNLGTNHAFLLHHYCRREREWMHIWFKWRTLPKVKWDRHLYCCTNAVKWCW